MSNNRPNITLLYCEKGLQVVTVRFAPKPCKIPHQNDNPEWTPALKSCHLSGTKVSSARNRESPTNGGGNNRTITAHAPRNHTITSGEL